MPRTRAANTPVHVPLPECKTVSDKCHGRNTFDPLLQHAENTCCQHPSPCATPRVQN